jgi:hypothetical protein
MAIWTTSRRISTYTPGVRGAVTRLVPLRRGPCRASRVFRRGFSSRRNAITLLGFDPAAKAAISSCKGSTREVLRHNRRSCNGTLRASVETLPAGSARPPDALVLRRCPPSAAHVAERTAPEAVAHVLELNLDAVGRVEQDLGCTVTPPSPPRNWWRTVRSECRTVPICAVREG